MRLVLLLCTFATAATVYCQSSVDPQPSVIAFSVASVVNGQKGLDLTSFNLHLSTEGGRMLRLLPETAMLSITDDGGRDVMLEHRSKLSTVKEVISIQRGETFTRDDLYKGLLHYAGNTGSEKGNGKQGFVLGTNLSVRPQAGISHFNVTGLVVWEEIIISTITNTDLPLSEYQKALEGSLVEVGQRKLTVRDSVSKDGKFRIFDVDGARCLNVAPLYANGRRFRWPSSSDPLSHGNGGVQRLFNADTVPVYRVTIAQTRVRRYELNTKVGLGTEHGSTAAKVGESNGISLKSLYLRRAAHTPDVGDMRFDLFIPEQGRNTVRILPETKITSIIDAEGSDLLRQADLAFDNYQSTPLKDRNKGFVRTITKGPVSVIPGDRAYLPRSVHLRQSEPGVRLDVRMNAVPTAGAFTIKGVLVTEELIGDSIQLMTISPHLLDISAEEQTIEVNGVQLQFSPDELRKRKVIRVSSPNGSVLMTSYRFPRGVDPGTRLATKFLTDELPVDYLNAQQWNSLSSSKGIFLIWAPTRTVTKSFKAVIGMGGVMAETTD